MQQTISISQALKLKNRFAGELKRLQGIIQRENSRQEGKPARFDVKELLGQVSKAGINLINIKAAIAKANADIYPFLAQLEETKATITFLKGINTKEGEHIEGFGANSHKQFYIATLNQADIEALTQEQQKVADHCQDKIDAYNATTQIVVEVAE